MESSDEHLASAHMRLRLAKKAFSSLALVALTLVALEIPCGINFFRQSGIDVAACEGAIQDAFERQHQQSPSPDLQFSDAIHLGGCQHLSTWKVKRALGLFYNSMDQYPTIDG